MDLIFIFTRSVIALICVWLLLVATAFQVSPPEDHDDLEDTPRNNQLVRAFAVTWLAAESLALSGGGFFSQGIMWPQVLFLMSMLPIAYGAARQGRPDEPPAAVRITAMSINGVSVIALFLLVLVTMKVVALTAAGFFSPR